MLFHGAAISYMPRWDPEHALRLIERDNITVFAGVPTMYFGLLHAANFDRVKRDSLTYCYSGGAPMPVEVMNEFDEKFRVNIMEGYGLSETSPVATFHTPERPRKVGSVGFPIFGCEVRIFNDRDEELPSGSDGEVVIRGQNVLKSYYRRPEATAETIRAGWFHTGDIGRLDEEGYLYIVDRKKDMIIRGGFNVYPRELEEILYGHPSVVECAVIGVPDAEHGEEIKAVIALRPGASLTEDELRGYCKERMAAYKYPRIYEFRAELPKGPTGKILKRELKGR
jgi:long-chain acyl-CoA synthetase